MSILAAQYMEGGQQGAQQQPAKAGGSDISALIAEEVADIKSGSGQPLTWHKTNITGLLYIALDKAAGIKWLWQPLLMLRLHTSQFASAKGGAVS